LLLSNNRISKVDSTFAEMAPKLESIILTNNKITNFSEIDNLATCKSLLRLSLVGNLVTNLPNYRMYVVFKIPSLRVLDFQKVGQKEKIAAKKMFSEGVGSKQLLKEMQIRQQEIESNL
jgi:U2 small nuclear ribonucleoprotein A'